jgi:hypothetical protein
MARDRGTSATTGQTRAVKTKKALRIRFRKFLREKFPPGTKLTDDQIWATEGASDFVGTGSRGRFLEMLAHEVSVGTAITAHNGSYRRIADKVRKPQPTNPEGTVDAETAVTPEAVEAVWHHLTSVLGPDASMKTAELRLLDKDFRSMQMHELGRLLTALTRGENPRLTKDMDRRYSYSEFGLAERELMMNPPADPPQPTAPTKLSLSGFSRNPMRVYQVLLALVHLLEDRTADGRVVAADLIEPLQAAKDGQGPWPVMSKSSQGANYGRALTSICRRFSQIFRMVGGSKEGSGPPWMFGLTEEGIAASELDIQAFVERYPVKPRDRSTKKPGPGKGPGKVSGTRSPTAAFQVTKQALQSLLERIRERFGEGVEVSATVVATNHPGRKGGTAQASAPMKRWTTAQLTAMAESDVYPVDRVETSAGIRYVVHADAPGDLPELTDAQVLLLGFLREQEVVGARMKLTDLHRICNDWEPNDYPKHKPGQDEVAKLAGLLVQHGALEKVDHDWVLLEEPPAPPHVDDPRPPDEGSDGGAVEVLVTSDPEPPAPEVMESIPVPEPEAQVDASADRVEALEAELADTKAGLDALQKCYGELEVQARVAEALAEDRRVQLEKLQAEYGQLALKCATQSGRDLILALEAKLQTYIEPASPD